MFCRHLGKFQTKKTLKFHLELNFKYFKNEKKEKIIIDCYNILSIEINITKFHVNMISDLGFTII